jgi:photosystem II stability/assembly factor-like uncharacterized protein
LKVLVPKVRGYKERNHPMQFKLTMVLCCTVHIALAQQWQFIGLQAERISAIAVDQSNQDVVFAGSQSDYSAGTVGGIFKSMNGGITWDTLMRGVTVRDLDLHPNDRQVLYATLGIHNQTPAGIVKTTDGGRTWNLADSGITIIQGEEGPYTLSIDPQHPETVYVGTAGWWGGKPYKSTDGGASWSRIDPDSNWYGIRTVSGDTLWGDPLEEGVTAIGINPLNSACLYEGTPMRGLVAKSPDGGRSWRRTGHEEGGIPTSIVFSTDTSTILLGCSWFNRYPVGLLKSTDSGITWVNEKAGLPDTFNVKKVLVCRRGSSELVFVAGSWVDSGGVYQSIDGQPWEQIGIGGGIVNTLDVSRDKVYVGFNGGIVVGNVAVSVRDRLTLPLPISFSLGANYPNPFNASTVIEYSIAHESDIFLQVIDLLGRKVKSLFHGRKQPGGYTTSWNGMNDAGQTVSSGFYLCVLESNKVVLSRKMLYLR